MSKKKHPLTKNRNHMLNKSYVKRLLENVGGTYRTVRTKITFIGISKVRTHLKTKKYV